MRRKQSFKRQRQQTWLDSLQQDSWNLELIVSGVTIFLLFGGLPYLDNLYQIFRVLQMGDSVVPTILAAGIGFLIFSYYILLGMFLLHLVLRGFWIAAIGLRSVSGGFDLPSLRYDQRYERYLTRRLGTFDDYVIKLERLSSVTFALAFLLFFALISLGLYIALFMSSVAVVSSFGKSPDYKEGQLYVVGGILTGVWVFSVFIGGLIYLIDFLTKGWFKRHRILGMLYWPVYRLLGWVTLAFLYRPLYYNVIDNAFSRRLIGWYSFVVFCFVIATALTVRTEFFFPFAADSEYMVHAGEYIDAVELSQLELKRASLSSKYATEDYLEVFLPYSKDLVKPIKRRYPDLEPEREYMLSFNAGLGTQDGPRLDTLLGAFRQVTRVRVNDSLYQGVNWRFYEHPVRNQAGLVWQLPTYDLPRGEHLLIIENERVGGDSVSWDTTAMIYFYR